MSAPRPNHETTQHLHKQIERLSMLEQRVLDSVLMRKSVVRDVNAEFVEQSSFGDRAADAIARFGGSWPFVLLFLVTLCAWIVANVALLARRGHTFDPYPFILLNLGLSMLAAIQAPIILMSQNRQSEKDRLDVAHDYEVNLKAEIEIQELHQKLDLLRMDQWVQLVAQQQRQIEMLERLVAQVG